MTIKFVDKNGSLKVVTIPDGADYQLEQDDDGTYSLYANIPRTKAVRMMPRKILAESLDKATADKCIERIYDQVIAKKDFCDLAEIQRGELVDTDHTDENNSE